MVLLTAGNLAVTQSVVSVLNEQIAADPDGKKATLMTVPSMYRAARLIGEALREVRNVDGAALEASSGFSASFILGGQIGDEPPPVAEPPGTRVHVFERLMAQDESLRPATVRVDSHAQ